MVPGTHCDSPPFVSGSVRGAELFWEAPKQSVSRCTFMVERLTRWPHRGHSVKALPSAVRVSCFKRFRDRLPPCSHFPIISLAQLKGSTDGTPAQHNHRCLHACIQRNKYSNVYQKATPVVNCWPTFVDRP